MSKDDEYYSEKASQIKIEKLKREELDELNRDYSLEGHTKKEVDKLIKQAPEFTKEINDAFNALLWQDRFLLADVLNHFITEIQSQRSIGRSNKADADIFARKIGKDLDKVRAEGYTSYRKIAARFNELGIPSPKGKKWNHVAVHDLIHRRRKLELE